MNQEQPKSVYDAPEPPWNLSKESPPEFRDHEKSTTEHTVDTIHPEDKEIQAVDISSDSENELEEVFPMPDEEEGEVIEAEEAPDDAAAAK